MTAATTDAARGGGSQTWPAALTWTGRGITGLVGLFMAFDVAIKLLNPPMVDQIMAPLGWPRGYGPPIGVLELALTGLYLVPRTAVIGAILLTGLCGGAIATHLRVGDSLFSHILFGLYLGVLAWTGLWLRSPALRALTPVARPGLA
jgi:hypothetical protein